LLPVLLVTKRPHFPIVLDRLPGETSSNHMVGSLMLPVCWNHRGAHFAMAAYFFKNAAVVLNSNSLRHPRIAASKPGALFQKED
jgi:hypothetical protein